VSATAAQPAKPRVVAEGRVVAYPGADVVVGCEVPGRIIRLPVQEKARVEAGQVLAELNAAELHAARAEAAARIAEAEADIRFYTRELKREETLLGRNAGTRQNLDAQRRSLELSEAHKALAQATVEKLDAQIEKTIIRAPISGVVTARHVDAGETIDAATPVVTIVNLDRLRIEAEVDEYDSFRVALGAPVELTAEGQEGHWSARVEEIPDAVVPRAMRPGDPGRPIDACVLLVKIAFASSAPFKIGQRVEVAIAVTEPQGEVSAALAHKGVTYLSAK
jgi:RND family efflux transporter MFP subunit